jgi:hypothetical protein
MAFRNEWVLKRNIGTANLLTSVHRRITFTISIMVQGNTKTRTLQLAGVKISDRIAVITFAAGRAVEMCLHAQACCACCSALPWQIKRMKKSLPIQLQLF